MTHVKFGTTARVGKLRVLTVSWRYVCLALRPHRPGGSTGPPVAGLGLEKSSPFPALPHQPIFFIFWPLRIPTANKIMLSNQVLYGIIVGALTLIAVALLRVCGRRA